MPALRQQSVNKQPRATGARSWTARTRNRPPPALRGAQKAALRVQAAKDTLKPAKEIVDSCVGGFGISLKISHKETKSLDTTLNHPIYPNVSTTQVKVINRDTLDAALALQNAGDIMEIKSKARVCVLNFANAYKAGGGWLKGASAQEEQICFRTTLGYAGLQSEFYPMKPDEGLYTSNVLILRENEERVFSWKWTKKPELLPLISVISVAATQGTVLDRTQTKYQKDNSCLEPWDVGHSVTPAGEVAECRVRVLQEEFKGWFEVIVFAVLDKPDGVNFTTFKKALHDLEM